MKNRKPHPEKKRQQDHKTELMKTLNDSNSNMYGIEY
jgi:hypothetical protein